MIQPRGHPELPCPGGDLQESLLLPQPAEFVQPQPAEVAYLPRHAQPPYFSQDWQEARAQPQLSDPVYSQRWPEGQARSKHTGFSGCDPLFTNASETSADTEKDQQTKEEGKFPVSNLYRSRIPRLAH